MQRFTLGDLKDQVYSRLESNDQMYKSSEVTNAINEAAAVANLASAWYQQTLPVSTSSTIADRHIYDVPSGIIFPQRVIFDGQVLEKSNLNALSNNWPTFLQDTTATTGKQVSRWCPLGIRKFVIHPADAIGGAALFVTGIADFDTLSNDSDYIYIPKEGVTAIADYAAHIVQCKLQGTPFMQSLAMFRNFQDLIKLQKYWLSYKQPTIYFDQQDQLKG